MSALMHCAIRLASSYRGSMNYSSELYMSTTPLNMPRCAPLSDVLFGFPVFTPALVVTFMASLPADEAGPPAAFRLQLYFVLLLSFLVVFAKAASSPVA